MTVFEWQAKIIEGAAAGVVHWMGTTRPDRLDWCPSAEADSNTRSVIQVVQECVGANRRIASLLRGDEQPPADAEPSSKSQELGEQLTRSAHELAEVVRSLDDSVLGRIYQGPRGPMPGAFLIQVPAFNMMYHSGQINYIQRLYGDIEFSFPGIPGN
ncbi:MAG: DinB family protein [Armatimonadota bacterium]|nr:DinB family protein [Armatimonadota bacterium]